MTYYHKERRAAQAFLSKRNQPIYDRKQFDAAATSETNYYFKDLATGSTPLVTNMNSSGQLGHPQSFQALGISFHVAMGTAPDDVIALYNGCYMKVYFSGIVKLEVPLFLIPDVSGLSGYYHTTATDTTSYSLSNGIPALQNFWPLLVPDDRGNFIPVDINSQEEFYAEVVYSGAALSANINTWAVLHGYYDKPVG
jgi:hypothetical protein